MVKGGEPKRRRAPVIRVQRRRRGKVRPTPKNASRRHTQSAPSSSVRAGAATSVDDSGANVQYQHTQLRTMRAERRDLLHQLTEANRERDDTERRAKAAEDALAEQSLLYEANSAERERVDTERRAKAAEDALAEQSTLDEGAQLLAETECRAKAAERERDDTERRAKAAEDALAEQSILYDEGTELWQNVWAQRDVSSVLNFPTNRSVICDSVELHHHGNDMPGVHAEGAIDNGRTTQSIWVKGAAAEDALAEQSLLYDEGTELWQNVWVQDDVSSVLTFPTNKSVICDSVESCHHGNDMPGVHAEGAIDNGRTTQSIWVKGAGYTLVGLVTSDDEKNALCRHAGADWSKMPLMTNVFSAHSDESKGDVFTIEVDMMERRAVLYVSGKDSSRRLEPEKVWENLPDKVWVAVAFKRNSGREAVLMPCIHWNMRKA
eukprot:CAMPEP_0172329068 /NCGR_PEP_ID=MMETSP1058-20130122/60681_1 /TAXON_ID=83371 /ORGANISM="Detonula confervacea, Strain CCMP 353" /LENGTH=434 /DNA_ID=CAMNT_0013046215 /DNA_START=247 /DNA_END=1552 /DNA_ORIENTATION=+